MTHPLAKEVAEWIRMELARRRLTQTELGQVLDLPQSSVSRVLRSVGREFTLSELAKVADYFGVPLEEIVGGRSAGNSGQHSVSPAPGSGETGSRERMDRAAASPDAA